MTIIDPLALHPEAVPVVAEWLFTEVGPSTSRGRPWGRRQPVFPKGRTLRGSHRLGRALCDGIPLAMASLLEGEEDSDVFGSWLAGQRPYGFFGPEVGVGKRACAPCRKEGSRWDLNAFF